MRANNLPSGAKYAAGYWAARPIQLYSNNQFIPIPLGPDIKNYTNAYNIKMIRNSEPRYVIAVYPADYEYVLKILGPANKEYCNMPMGMPFKGKSPDIGVYEKQ